MSLSSRRSFLGATAAACITGGFAGVSSAQPSKESEKNVTESKPGKPRIRQSIMGWCFKPMPVDQLAKACAEIGLVAMEGVPASSYPTVKAAGLEISLVGSHGFAKGFCDPDQHEPCAAAIRKAIDTAVEYGCPNVITFTGMKKKGLSFEQMEKNCVEGWKKVIGYAEEKKINLCLEHLNSRDDTHPMKGHPGYFGDDVDHCVEMIKKVDSPRMKLLFDVYHVQIMNGDVIRRIGQYKDYIGHYHTAGVPGRGELDENQEVNYPAVMRAILATGFAGFVAQEFIPTWDDKLKALRHAYEVCNV